MSRVAFRRVVAAITVLTVAFALFWLTSPVGAGPGTPLRMYSADGTDLHVAALTYTEGPDPRWKRLGEASSRIIPSRLLLEAGTFEMGSGQDLALDAGVDAAATVLRKSVLEEPVGVYPGVVTGTSSGLAWAVATILLSDPSLREGGVIYATGSLHSSDSVGSINGLAEKLRTAGLKDARVVFVPAAQFDEAVSALNIRGDFETAELVVGVASVSEALAYLCESTPDATSCSPGRSGRPLSKLGR